MVCNNHATRVGLPESLGCSSLYHARKRTDILTNIFLKQHADPNALRSHGSGHDYRLQSVSEIIRIFEWVLAAPPLNLELEP